MTEKDYNKASAIMKEISALEAQIKILPRIIRSHKEYNDSHQKYGYVKRILAKIKNKFYVYAPNLYPEDYGRWKYVCELSEEDLSALVKIRNDKLAALKQEMQQLGEEQE